MPLVDRVRRTIRRGDLVVPGGRIVAAVSGGADSVALAHVLAELTRRNQLQLVALAHLNHQLRDEAARDESFCGRLAAELGLPLVTERADVRERARAERRSIEDAAHQVRYEFFERARVAHGADRVAVGHTKDDQAETFLLRLTRGAGSRGLGGMYPRAGVVIRPLLDCRRRELRAWLDARNIPYVHDASNDDLTIPRNRVRAELLPLLERRFNPSIVEALARESELARADDLYLETLATEWWQEHARHEPSGWALAAPELQALPMALARRVLHLAMRKASAGRPIGFDHVAHAWGVVAGEADAVDAPGHRVQRVGDCVVLMTRPAGSVGRRASADRLAPYAFRYSLPVPGEVVIPEIRCEIAAEVADAAPALDASSASVALVPRALLQGTALAVRNRRAGDRLRPSRVGRRKLQDLLVDRKVPRAERDRIPIVVDAADRIVWVAGHAIDQDFRVTDPSQAVVILRLKGVGGSF
jgi:tRNA(Ile)-lysidine synthase